MHTKRHIQNRTLIINLIYIGLTFFSIQGCKNQIENLKVYPDPFKESFYGSNINTTIRYTEGDSLLVDTLVYDSLGNLIIEKSMFGTKRYQYDENGFYTRYYDDSDTDVNYVINNSWKDNELIQKWYPIKHMNWKYNFSDIDSINSYIVRYSLDTQGRVIREDFEKNGNYVLYGYNNPGKLIRKEKYTKGGEKFETFKYFYNTKLLDSIEFYFDNKKIYTHYFKENGLIDSTTHMNYKLLYKHFKSSNNITASSAFSDGQHPKNNNK